MNNYTIDLNKNRIEFLDSRFYATPSGGYVPSVTTILECFPKGAEFYKWLKEMGGDADTIRDEAGRRGSTVHALTERYDDGEEVSYLDHNGFPAYKNIEWAMFERYVDFCTTHKPSIEMMEAHFVSEKLGFAGTLDRVVTLNGKRILLDIKTSNSVQDSYWLQLSAYYELLSEIATDVKSIDEVGILWLNAKTRTTGKGGAIQGVGWQLITKPISEVLSYWTLFQATHQLWLYMNETTKPRQLSYTLKHKK